MNIEQLFPKKITYCCPYCQHCFKENTTTLEIEQECVKCRTIFQIGEIKILHVYTKIKKEGKKQMKAIPIYKLNDDEHFCFPEKSDVIYKLHGILDEAYYDLLDSNSTKCLMTYPETLVRRVE